MKTFFHRLSDARYITFFTILLSSMMLVSCGGSKVKFSGYLHDYSKLKPYENGFRWISPDTDFSKYTKIILEPVTFFVGGSLSAQDVKNNPDNINKITDYFHTAIVREFSKDYEIVDKAGPDVMRFKVAITAVQVQAKDLEAYQYIPVMLVATGAAEVAGLRDKVAIISMEGEVLDSLTGKRIGAVVKSSSKETTIKDKNSLKAQDVKNILDHWAAVGRATVLKQK